MTKIDKIVKIDNSNNTEPVTFVPKGQNFTYTIGAGDTLEFKTDDSSAQLYYVVQNIPGAVVSTQDHFDDGPIPPTGLTPFEVGQTISGFDFGDVQNGDTNAEMDAWLAGLTYDDYNHNLITFGDGSILMATDLSAGGYDGYAIVLTTGGVLYSTVAFYDYTSGYNGLTDGKFSIGQSVTVDTIDDTTPPTWNGIFIGAVEAQPQPASLTPFYDGKDGEHDATVINNGDYIVFDTSKGSDDGSACELLTFLTGLETAGEGGTSLYDKDSNTCYLVSTTDPNVNPVLLAAARIERKDEPTVYALMAGAGTDTQVGWSSDTYPEAYLTQGWMGLDTQDRYAKYELNLSSVPWHVTSVESVAGWNGVIVGYEAGGGGSSLTPFQNGDTVSAIQFNLNLTNADVISFATEHATEIEQASGHRLEILKVFADGQEGAQPVVMFERVDNEYAIVVGVQNGFIYSTFAGNIDGIQVTEGYQSEVPALEPYSEYYQWDGDNKILTITFPFEVSFGNGSAPYDGANGEIYGKVNE